MDGATDADHIEVDVRLGSELVIAYEFDSFERTNSFLLALKTFLDNQVGRVVGVKFQIGATFHTDADIGSLLKREPTGENPLALEWEEVKL